MIWKVGRRFAVRCLFITGLLGRDTDGYASHPGSDPVADSASVVIDRNVRFTLLTPQLVRMEWSEAGRFEDRASLVFTNRRLAPVRFTRSLDEAWLTIETASLRLRYRRGSGKFRKDNLEVHLTVGGKDVVWMPGTESKGNLFGTIRTLDGVKGATTLESGLLSRDGWEMVDDSERPLFDESEWPWVTARPASEHQDWYFFGYGRDYKRLLGDFTKMAGKIPMPPRFAFGLWWSRYWAYTDQEFKQLVREFEIHDVPLDVLVVDMDWHQTFGLRWGKQPKDQAGQPLGWTGYTWDSAYFPDPTGFLEWCEKKGLKTPLNLHPASGIQPHEEQYPAMARAMGMDPSSRKYVPFDIVDKKFATNYLNVVLRPLEKQGVDFWWLDWQQWGTTKIPGVTPTWWLNYVHFSDMERQGTSRPLLFHRWGGLGNHRYQIGFSGDAISVWESLAFQPYFTATAANVGYGYWSHDIGGHMPGVISPELYTRWLQFGVFSPIIRTHTTKNPEAERRIWAYPVDYFLNMRDAILLRYALIPYVYTAARIAFDTGISICHPMYYDHPDVEEAYSFRDQYMFGDCFLVAPAATAVSQDSALTSKRIWLPEGDWYEWFSGTWLSGPGVIERFFAIDEIPVYVKAGSIIPMQPKMKNSREKPVDPLILVVMMGDSDTAALYEDEGNSLGYQKGEYTWTRIYHNQERDGLEKIIVMPSEGVYPGMLKERAYEIRVPGALPPRSVTCNGRSVPYRPDGAIPGWRYDGGILTTIISLPKFDVREKVTTVIQFDEPSTSYRLLSNGVPGKLRRLQRVMGWLSTQWPKDWSPESLVRAEQTGRRISIRPERARKELEMFQSEFPAVLNDIRSMDADPLLLQRAANHLTAWGQK